MENALDKALANASLNAKMNGDSLHTENLDSIADPTLDQFDPNRDGVLTSKTSFPNPRTEFELLQNYQQQMESEYAGKAVISSQNTLTLSSIDYKLGEITNAVMYTHKEAELTKLRLDALADMVTEISTTITKAASMSDHKHRSLHEWDDSSLLNELVERENDLMPFYYELLKRIGSPELQKLVMSSMQGKNASMVTLAHLCSALAPKASQPQHPTMISSGDYFDVKANPQMDFRQPQYKPIDHTLADAYKQLEDALPPYDKFSRQHREEATALVNQYKLPIEQRDALSDHDFKAYQSFMNELLHRSTLMERVPNRESVVPKAPYPTSSQTYNPYSTS